MKKLLLAILAMFCLDAASQNISAYDLCMLNQITDINLITHFLVNTKGFTYVGNFGKDEEGWNIYKFSKDQNIMEVGIGYVDGNNLVNINYLIYSKIEYDGFYQSLAKFNFKKNESGRFNDGTPYEYWRGTNSLLDKLTTIIVSDKETFKKININ